MIYCRMVLLVCHIFSISEMAGKTKHSGFLSLLDRLFLPLSDCDGMCNLCNLKLRTKCFSIKNNTK